MPQLELTILDTTKPCLRIIPILETRIASATSSALYHYQSNQWIAMNYCYAFGNIIDFYQVKNFKELYMSFAKHNLNFVRRCKQQWTTVATTAELLVLHLEMRLGRWILYHRWERRWFHSDCREDSRWECREWEIKVRILILIGYRIPKKNKVRICNTSLSFRKFWNFLSKWYSYF